MKSLIFSLLSLIFTLSLSAQTRKNIEANPINVAVSLMHRTDTASMSSALRYYGYGMQASQPADGFTVYTHPNGSTINYKYADSHQPFPTVELTSKVSAKERDEILQDLKFEKVGNAYEQKSIGFTTRCQLGPHGTIILQRIPKSKK